MHTIVFRFRAALLAHQPERRKIHDVPSTNDSRDVVVVLASATRHAYVLYSRTSLNDTASAEMARRQLRDHIEGARREGGRIGAGLLTGHCVRKKLYLIIRVRHKNVRRYRASSICVMLLLLPFL